MGSNPTVTSDLILSFGDRQDAVIGVPCITFDGQVVEASYFYGDAKPKNIINISSQAGCPASCSFCELGGERFVRNLTPEEMNDQVYLVLEFAALHGFNVQEMPHKVTVANTGEPLLNPGLVDGLRLIGQLPVSFKVSTVLPNTRRADEILLQLAHFAAEYPRPVQLQISLISTSEDHRVQMSGIRTGCREHVRKAAELWSSINPNGRKVNLSLILTNETPVDAEYAAQHYPPELFNFRFREYVPTQHGTESGHSRLSQDQLAAMKEAFRRQGYEVADFATPSPTEVKFGLAGNVIRRIYLDLVNSS